MHTISDFAHAALDPRPHIADDVLPELGRLSAIGFLFDPRVVDAMVDMRVAALGTCDGFVVPCGGDGELCETVADIVQLLVLTAVAGDAVGIFAQRVSLCLQRVVDNVTWQEQGHVLAFAFIRDIEAATTVFALAIDGLKIAEFAVADEAIVTVEGRWDNVRTLSRRLYPDRDDRRDPPLRMS